MRKRTLAREFAMQALYMVDLRKSPDLHDFTAFRDSMERTVEQGARKLLEKRRREDEEEEESPPVTREDIEQALGDSEFRIVLSDYLGLGVGFVLKVLRSQDVELFARTLFEGTLRHRAEIDDALAKAAQNWQLKRMAIVDRNILRMAVYEMLYADEIPSKVSINEAIELGKRYSTQQSGSFINGILDRIRREKQL